jgi:hypothetical protein
MEGKEKPPSIVKLNSKRRESFGTVFSSHMFFEIPG